MGPSTDGVGSGAPWPDDCCCFPVILDFCGGIVVALVVASVASVARSVGRAAPRWSLIGDRPFR